MFYGECNVLPFTIQNLPLIAHEANFDNILHAEIVPSENVQYTPDLIALNLCHRKKSSGLLMPCQPSHVKQTWFQPNYSNNLHQE